MFERWHQASLRRTLLTVLLPAMLLAVAGELWLTWRTALDAANAAYDRSLLGAIKAMDANISTESGGLGVELPYRLLEFFELTANGQVFFRVSTEDGLVEIGNSDLPPPPPPRELPTGRAVFSDATYLDQPLRLGAYARELDPPLSGTAGSQRVVIQIGETTGSRREFTQALVLQSVARNLLLLALGAVLVVGIIAWALRPLERLRSEVAARSPEDMRPVRSSAIPADVQPLVEAINQHIERHREASEARRAFIDDASHQLRTPLTTLATQLGYALRESDPALQREALQALRSQLDETVRQTNQMLALARADSAELPSELVDATALAEAVTRAAWPLARELGLDLGFEPAAAPAWVRRPAGAAARGAVEPGPQRHALHAARRAGHGARGGAGQRGGSCGARQRPGHAGGGTGACRRALLPRQPRRPAGLGAGPGHRALHRPAPRRPAAAGQPR
jgi:two-component system, OmpR family, sensor histidine kinase TctE